MNSQPIIPDPVVTARLIRNSRRARLDFEEAGLLLEEAIAKFDEILRQQKLERIQKREKL